MATEEQLYYRSNDKPIKEEEKDELYITERVVSNISNFLKDSQDTSLTVAITGEWGIGKTSVMNLLAEDLSRNEKNIIIRFEPLLEGKLEILEIMELFYLKLYAELKTKIDDVKNIFEKLLTSLLVVPLTGTTIKLSIPLSKTGVDIDVKEIANKLLDTWGSKKGNLFSEETKALNKKIKKLNIFIFIDEIDRLPAKHIISFLMFARILEEFDNLTCIVGIDYARVIQSLKSDTASGVSSYEEAKDYLDKLFQARFDINHNLGMLTSFARSQLEKIDKLTFEKFFGDKDYTIHNKLLKIVEYLKTPRQIKKWATMTFIHKILIKYYYEDIMHLLMLCAICVKHPIILDDLASKILPLLSNRNHNDDSKKLKEFQDRLLENTRITDGKNNDVFKEACISDIVAHRFLEEILNEKSIKVSLLSLLVRGYENETQVKVYTDYFGQEVNNALRWLIDHEHASNVIPILSDLTDALSKNQSYPIAIADIDLINQLGQTLISPEHVNSEYSNILIALLSKFDTIDIIQKADLELLVLYIDAIRYFSYKNSSLTSFYNMVSSEIDYSKENLSHWLQQAILRIELDISSIDKTNALLERGINLIAVFYSFHDWCKKEKISGRLILLSDNLCLYFNNDKVSQKNKIFLANLLFTEYATYTEKEEENDEDDNFLHDLFSHKLINQIKIFKTTTIEEVIQKYPSARISNIK